MLFNNTELAMFSGDECLCYEAAQNCQGSNRYRSYTSICSVAQHLSNCKHENSLLLLCP